MSTYQKLYYLLDSSEKAIKTQNELRDAVKKYAKAKKSTRVGSDREVQDQLSVLKTIRGKMLSTTANVDKSASERGIWADTKKSLRVKYTQPPPNTDITEAQLNVYKDLFAGLAVTRSQIQGAFGEKMPQYMEDVMTETLGDMKARIITPTLDCLV